MRELALGAGVAALALKVVSAALLVARQLQPSRGIRVWGLEFGVWGLGFRVWGLGFGVYGLGFGVLGFGFWVWGLGFRV